MFTHVALDCHTQPYWKAHAPTKRPPAPPPMDGKMVELEPPWNDWYAARYVAALTADGSSA